MRTALAGSGIVFFFLVGLGAGTYFDRAPTDLSSGPAAAATESVPADHPFTPPALVTTAEKAPPAPEPAPAAPPVAQAEPMLPPALPVPEETTAAAPPQPVAPPTAPAPQEATIASGPPPAQAAAPAKVALAAPPRPEAKPAAAPAALKPVVLHRPTIHPVAPSDDKGSGPFRIQFGAFRHEENARRLSEAVSTPAMKASVTPGRDHQGRPLYYVRSPDFPEFARALAAAWDAQNAAQKLHFNEPITYLIQRVPHAETAAAPSEATEIAAGAR